MSNVLRFYTVASLLLACGPEAVPTDAPVRPDVPMEDGGDIHDGLRLPRCEDSEAGAVDDFVAPLSTLEATVVSMVPRLAEPGPLNPASEEGELMYRAMGVGRVSRGPALSLVLRDDLGGGPPPTTGRRSLAWIGIESDFQLADDESPGRYAGLDNTIIPSGLRAQEGYLPRAISALNRTFVRIADAGRDFDFGIVTGDCADSAQRNELEWVIQIMDGATGVDTDSGDDDDPVPGPDNDPKDPFDAVGFPAPWLYVPGNHDVEIVGITAPNDSNRAAAVGTRAGTGARDYRLWYAEVTNRDVPADPAREIVDRDDIVAALLADTAGPGPVGHGYPAGADVSAGAHYVYDAIPGLLRIVTIDTNDPDGGSEGMIHRATIDDWLVPTLEEAEADGVLVMLASHHSTPSIDVYRGQVGMTVEPTAVPPEEIETIVASHDVVIAWLVGHSHDNRIRAVGHDATHRGYWEIMTAALADWPGQARTLEVVDNGDGTLSLLSATIDLTAESCMERRFRTLLDMEWVTGWVPDVSASAGDQSVEMLIDIPASAAAAVAARSATAPDVIETLTTLTGT